MSIDLTATRERAEAARQAIEKAQTELSASVKEAISEGFKPIFEKYPFLGSVVWTQYTPYFNDGEPCVFGSTFTYPSINSAKDIEDGTDCHYGDEYGQDFYKHESENVYAGYDSETRKSQYVKSEDFDPTYLECSEAVQSLVKTIAGNEKRNYSDYQPTNFDLALLRIFGDHASVTVTRDGIKVDKYDHE